MASEVLERRTQQWGGQRGGRGHRTGCDAPPVADARRTGQLPVGGGFGNTDDPPLGQKPPTTTVDGATECRERDTTDPQSSGTLGDKGERGMADKETGATTHHPTHLIIHATSGATKP